MNSSTRDVFITMPLTLAAHQQAQQFYQHQSEGHKAKQVYLNTLAVHAVHSYLKWLGIETDLETSDCWNPALQTLADVADLIVVGKGKLECRPVLPDETACRVPAEVWSGWLGFVAVQVNDSLQDATLLGFLPEVSKETVPLAEWRSLDDLLVHLDNVDSLDSIKPASASPASVRPSPTPLAQWLDGVIAAGWQELETLMYHHQPAFSFRGSEPVESPAMQGKLLNLGDTLQVALLLGITPATDSEMEIWVKLCPHKNQDYLPVGLELAVLDEAGEPAMQAQSRKTEMIQLKFSGTLGEQFSIKVNLGSVSVTETFVI